MDLNEITLRIDTLIRDKPKGMEFTKITSCYYGFIYDNHEVEAEYNLKLSLILSDSGNLEDDEFEDIFTYLDDIFNGKVNISKIASSRGVSREVDPRDPRHQYG